MKKTATALVITAFALTACGSTENSKASGLLDEVKSAKAVAGVPAKTRVVPNTGVEGYCAAYKDGRCTLRSTRPKTGTRIETIEPGKPAKSAMYCVELDNVNGNKDRDDVLFQVNHATYLKWVGANEGVKVTDMSYLREVTTCQN